MDRTTRWETEALRNGPSGRPSPPRPTGKRRTRGTTGDAIDDRSWVTLREAEAETGIPINTLRKWVRKAGLASYLESDGRTPVRMVDLDAVRRRAEELGREIEVVSPQSSVVRGREPSAVSRAPSAARDPEPRESRPETPPETMIVPVDAWNKMLSQLGNLHEAGQQLAEARERAARAETEAEFLRRRLAEMRGEGGPASTVDPDVEAPPPEHAATPDAPEPTPTTTFFRYVTKGWRNRRKKS